MHRGLIFDIQRYSIHDGPGIRTIVFFKGCPLQCLWCSNPESQKPYLEEMVVRDRSKKIGMYVNAKEVVKEVEKDRAFYRRSKGGITLSGGEPLMQPELALEILKLLKSSGFETAIETAGCQDWEVIKEVSNYTDLILFDLKHMDDKKHQLQTGISNRIILENAIRISEYHRNIIFRIPLIPGYNDDAENLYCSGKFVAAQTSGNSVEIVPYHRMGAGKYKSLGREYALASLEPPRKEKIEEAMSILESCGLRVTIAH